MLLKSKVHAQTESAKLRARGLRASCPTFSRASQSSCLTCLWPYVPRAKPAAVSRMSYVLLYLTYLCLAYFRAASNSTCTFAPRPSLAAGVSSLTCSYVSEALRLSCLVSLVLLLLELSEFFIVWAKVIHCDR